MKYFFYAMSFVFILGFGSARAQYLGDNPCYDCEGQYVVIPSHAETLYEASKPYSVRVIEDNQEYMQDRVNDFQINTPYIPIQTR